MSTEKIKSNSVAARTLFVGVGGTGSKIVTRVAEMCRPGETENINFVCMDTNANDLRNVKKSSANLYYIQTSSTQTVGDYLYYDSDARTRWFPKNTVLYPKTVSEGAGQVRAISRLALNSIIKTGVIQPLYDAIDDLFRKDGQDLQQALRVVIASTASGGTGSGMLLPLAMLIRAYVSKKYPSTGAIIRVMLMLPEALDSVIKSDQEKASQRRNAYATVKELNAFMMMGSGFCKTAEELARYQNLHVDVATANSDELQRLALLPCDFCFLMDGQDAEGTTMVTLNQYIQQAAQALYEQNIGPMQQKAFSEEDNVIKEQAAPGAYARNRFGGIGAATLRYPYDSVTEYVACSWAIGNIGGEGEAAKWSRYDKEYKERKREAVKKGIPVSDPEYPTLAAVYTDTVDNSDDFFSTNLRDMYLTDAEDIIGDYFKNLYAEMRRRLYSYAPIAGMRSQANMIKTGVDHNSVTAPEIKDILDRYWSTMQMYARTVGKAAAKGVFSNPDTKIGNCKEYMLESLMRREDGAVLHPNAMRYMLYKVRGEMQEGVTSAANAVKSAEKQMRPYIFSGEDLEGQGAAFDASITKKEVERTWEEFIAAEGSRAKDSLYESYYRDMDGYARQFLKAIEKWGEKNVELIACQTGLEYVDDLCSAMEAFFDTFATKVAVLERRKEDIVSDLKFRKGDSVLNVCAGQALLDELVAETPEQNSDGMMIDSDLCSKIYDAIKENAAFERETRYLDVVENDRRIDVFDQVMLGFYLDTVRRLAENLDMNIVEAIAKEHRLTQRVKLRESMSGGKKVYDHVSNEDCEHHILEVIAKGRRLAAPSIQKMVQVAPRQVAACAYNECLSDMRSYDISALVTDGIATDTISRYEMHFFTALYNITPDKLSKFAAEVHTETGTKAAGLYHEAYQEYARNIGPDSTKTALISTHIDKRWDSLAAMPELDFGFQREQIMRIHQALIYALVYKAILHQPDSQRGGKKVYKYIDSDEYKHSLIVSNGTTCDEFFEILDSFYISSAIVEDIHAIHAALCERDLNRNANFEATSFARELTDFELDGVHTGDTSLFEIPLVYFNTLPNRLRYDDEISSLVNAVVKVIEEILLTIENPTDVPLLLSEKLIGQFQLFINNYNAYPELNKGVALRDSMVADLVYRKVKNCIANCDQMEDQDFVLSELKAMMR